MFHWTHAPTTSVDYEALLQGTNAVTVLVDDLTKIRSAEDANVVFVFGRARGTNAVSVFVTDLTFFHRTRVFCEVIDQI